VDQELIRRELEMGGYAKPSASEADALLRNFRQSRFHSLAEYRAATRKYGIAEDQSKQHLVWQLTAIRFTDSRFGSVEAEGGSQSADRAISLRLARQTLRAAVHGRQGRVSIADAFPFQWGQKVHNPM
jgi:hypothetical protein